MKRLQFGISLVLCLTFLGSCGWFGEGSDAKGKGRANRSESNWGKPKKPSFKIPVTVEQIDRDRMYAYLQAVGTVVPTKEIELKCEMPGRIYYTKRWMEGDQVEKGEVLATIDDRQLRLDLNEAQQQLYLAKAALEPARAQLEQAKKDEEFKKIMHERGAISKAEVDLAVLTRIQREHSFEEAKQNIETRRTAVERLKQELEKTEIVVPWNGVLLPSSQNISTTGSSGENTATDLTLNQGQQVGSAQVLCRLATIDKVYVALDVPAKDLTEVEKGQEVELEIYSRSGTEYRGVVKDISTALSASTRTYTVNVLVDNPNHELRPGMFAKARIITEERLDAISIPRTMVQLRNNRHVVFVVKEKQEDETRSPVERQEGEGREAPPRQIAMAGKTDSSRGSGNTAYAADITSSTGENQIEINPDLEPEAIEEETPDNPFDDENVTWVAEERVVQLGIENRENVEIVSGLREGEYLVVLGYETLTDGVDVNVTLRDDENSRLNTSAVN